MKKFSNIAYFSAFVLLFTLFAYCVIIYKCIVILDLPIRLKNSEYNLDIKNTDFQYLFWNISMLPSFCSAMMNLFEGNQQILNLYAEAESPKKFFKLIMSIFIILTFTIVLGVGILGYVTFGDTVQSLIIYNLPN